MKVTIAGCGAVGRNLAGILVREGNNVTVIDRNRANLDAVEERLDVAAVEGPCTDIKTLKLAGVVNCDVFVAATDDDEKNVLSAAAAKKLGAGRTIARCRNPIYTSGGRNKAYAELMDIDLVVNPEDLTALEIVKLLKAPGALVIENFAMGKAQVREIVVGAGSDAAEKTLAQLSLSKLGLVAAISRAGGIIIPKGDTRILPEDKVFIIGKQENLTKLMSAFGGARPKGRKIIILGGGKVGLAASQLVEKENLNLIVIEKDRERALTVSENLKKALVLVGDGTDIDLLKEKDIENTDYFVALSGDDEDNIVSGLLAKDLGAKSSIVMVERPEYVAIVERLGIDHAVSPRLLTVTEILRFLKKGRFASVAMLENEGAELVEARIHSGSKIAGKRLSEAGIPSGTIIGAIVRGESVIVPTGADSVMSGDTLIVFTAQENIPKLENLMG
ncbi:MAG TPA: Trk system potassium transporter TrkA [bacterium]|nr:MAG: Trk system potassium uptake protein TrkA [bacterium ADurb.Bin236]HOY63016.1 Trk system potassium transporter TrkA [bacterium]HPI75143.1 Trk system potassium transporter TrkA [bacterium]HPN94485.1 Trk system potassium transporter TrkA [bacterium]